MQPDGKLNWENVFSVIEPQINAEGLHVWPFDPSFPVDVRFFALDQPNNLRMNRHDYFELTYIRSGEVAFQIQERYFDVREGDLVVIGNTLYHRITGYSRLPLQIVVLYFLPDLVRGSAASGDDIEYMMPFLIQDEDFPHVIHSGREAVSQIVDLMKLIEEELPPDTIRARLAVKTYLKMILMLLVNHYSGYSGARRAFDRRMFAIQRLRPLFEYLELHYDQPVTVQNDQRQLDFL
jgi:mannose-6-phosphate isomerase-like protein (cupin superfamily)